MSASPWRSLGQRLRRMRAVARIETLHLLRDKTTRSLIFLVPTVQLVLFGYAIDLDPKDVSIAIARPAGNSTDRLRRTIDETGYFSVTADGLPSGGAERMVAETRALIGIELPPLPSYGEDDAPVHPVRVVVDATDPGAIRPALAALETAYWRSAAQECSLVTPPTADVTWLYNPEGRTSWTIVPGLVGVVVMISMLMMGALTLVRERERGSWETLLATPVDALDALVGKLGPYVVVGVLQASAVLLLARLLFQLPAEGALWALLLAIPLYAGAHLALGFAFSALAESQMQAIQGAVFFYLPSMLLSGFMFPLQGMPGWARTIGEALPLTHFVRVTRGVLLRGEGAVWVLGEMGPVALFALAAGLVAVLAYRQRIE
jgi:ABC-2 type transport system permease protein